VCRCGHVADAHEHFRPGSDCGACGRVACPAYREDVLEVDADALDSVATTWLRPEPPRELVAGPALIRPADLSAPWRPAPGADVTGRFHP
jgi:hypothetical protein